MSLRKAPPIAATVVIQVPNEIMPCTGVQLAGWMRIQWKLQNTAVLKKARAFNVSAWLVQK